MNQESDELNRESEYITVQVTPQLVRWLEMHGMEIRDGKVVNVTFPDELAETPEPGFFLREGKDNSEDSN